MLIEELSTYEQLEKNEIAERIEELFYAALNEMTTNQIADLEMVDYLCKPIVKAIESDFYSCSEFYHPFFFSDAKACSHLAYLFLLLVCKMKMRILLILSKLSV